MFDDAELEVNKRQFKQFNWKLIYRIIGRKYCQIYWSQKKSVIMSIFCDAAFADNFVIRRSQSGVFIFLNVAPITWYSKQQHKVEISTFGFGFIVLRDGCEINDGLRYKLKNDWRSNHRI